MFACAIGLSLSACKSQASKDAAAKAKIEALVPGVAVEVKNGVATIKGTMPSEQAKTAAETSIKGIEGIKSLVINATIAGPTSQTGINSNQTLTDAVASLLKDFKGVNATVSDGTITLSGNIAKADWMKLRPLLDALEPKQVISAALKID